MNKQLPLGDSLAWVVSHAGAVRFRPIVLTSVTTFVGLAPMMVDTTISTSLFKPMAVSLGFGVLFGTVITLFIVPCLLLALDDFARLIGKRKPSQSAHAEV